MACGLWSKAFPISDFGPRQRCPGIGEGIRIVAKRKRKITFAFRSEKG